VPYLPFLSRAQDLLNQIKQITIGIHDIKDKRKDNIGINRISNTFNVRSHILNGPLQEHHEEHDEDGVHYKDNIGTNHP